MERKISKQFSRLIILALVLVSRESISKINTAASV